MNLYFFLTAIYVAAILPAVLSLRCYWCSGVGSQRDCERTPSDVTTGPVFVNCQTKYCISTKVMDAATGEVKSFARLCANIPRGNICIKDARLITCFETCTKDFCNHGNPDPTTLGSKPYSEIFLGLPAPSTPGHSVADQEEENGTSSLSPLLSSANVTTFAQTTFIDNDNDRISESSIDLEEITRTMAPQERKLVNNTRVLDSYSNKPYQCEEIVKTANGIKSVYMRKIENYDARRDRRKIRKKWYEQKQPKVNNDSDKTLPPPSGRSVTLDTWSEHDTHVTTDDPIDLEDNAISDQLESRDIDMTFMSPVKVARHFLIPTEEDKGVRRIDSRIPPSDLHQKNIHSHYLHGKESVRQSEALDKSETMQPILRKEPLLVNRMIANEFDDEGVTSEGPNLFTIAPQVHVVSMPRLKPTPKSVERLKSSIYKILHLKAGSANLESFPDSPNDMLLSVPDNYKTGSIERVKWDSQYQKGPSWNCSINGHGNASDNRWILEKLFSNGKALSHQNHICSQFSQTPPEKELDSTYPLMDSHEISSEASGESPLKANASSFHNDVTQLKTRNGDFQARRVKSEALRSRFLFSGNLRDVKTSLYRKALTVKQNGKQEDAEDAKPSSENLLLATKDSKTGDVRSMKYMQKVKGRNGGMRRSLKRSHAKRGPRGGKRPTGRVAKAWQKLAVLEMLNRMRLNKKRLNNGKYNETVNSNSGHTYHVTLANGLRTNTTETQSEISSQRIDNESSENLNFQRVTTNEYSNKPINTAIKHFTPSIELIITRQQTTATRSTDNKSRIQNEPKTTSINHFPPTRFTPSIEPIITHRQTTKTTKTRSSTQNESKTTSRSIGYLPSTHFTHSSVKPVSTRLQTTGTTKNRIDVQNERHTTLRRHFSFPPTRNPRNNEGNFEDRNETGTTTAELDIPEIPVTEGGGWNLGKEVPPRKNNSDTSMEVQRPTLFPAQPTGMVPVSNTWQNRKTLMEPSNHARVTPFTRQRTNEVSVSATTTLTTITATTEKEIIPNITSLRDKNIEDFLRDPNYIIKYPNRHTTVFNDANTNAKKDSTQYVTSPQGENVMDFLNDPNYSIKYPNRQTTGFNNANTNQSPASPQEKYRTHFSNVPNYSIKHQGRHSTENVVSDLHKYSLFNVKTSKRPNVKSVTQTRVNSYDTQQDPPQRQPLVKTNLMNLNGGASSRKSTPATVDSPINAVTYFTSAQPIITRHKGEDAPYITKPKGSRRRVPLPDITARLPTAIFQTPRPPQPAKGNYSSDTKYRSHWMSLVLVVSLGLSIRFHLLLSPAS